jgi:hypothetical protein
METNSLFTITFVVVLIGSVVAAIWGGVPGSVENENGVLSR